MLRWSAGVSIVLLIGAGWLYAEDSAPDKAPSSAAPAFKRQTASEAVQKLLDPTSRAQETNPQPSMAQGEEATQRPADATTVEPIALRGSVPFTVASYYQEVTVGRRIWQGVAFEFAKNGVMATRDSEAVINIGRTQVEHLYLVQCARGDFARNERLGSVEFVFANGDPAHIDLIAGRNTNYANKKTDGPEGPYGFHVLDWVNPDPARNLISANVTLTSNTRIHLLAATLKLGRGSTRTDLPQTNGASPRKNVLTANPVSDREPMIRTTFIPLPLNASPSRTCQKNDVKFAVHRIPLEATNTGPLHGLRLAQRGIVKIHFLHCGRRNLNANQQAGYYEMAYSDGTRERFYLVTERNINYPDWSRAGLRTTVGDPSGLEVTTWENPHPDKILQSLDLLSSNSVTIQLWAMTLERTVDERKPLSTSKASVRSPGASAAPK